MVCYLYHQYAKTDFGNENISHRLNISKKTVIDHSKNKHDIKLLKFLCNNRRVTRVIDKLA